MRNPLSDEHLDALHRRFSGIVSKIEEGGLGYQKVLNGLKGLSEGRFPGRKSSILRLISRGKPIVIGATSGTKTIASAEDVFTWDIDSNFKNWGLDVPGEAKPETSVEVHEIVEDGNPKAIFDSLPGDLDQLCLEQEQIIAFVRDHKKWLRTDGYATLFLFKVRKGKKKQFFVAEVGLAAREGPGADVSRFSNDDVLYAEYHHRLVVPRLALAA